MELNDALRKVRLLIAKAEHPGTDSAEAGILRQKADELMLKNAIDAAALEASKPPELRGQPEILIIDLVGEGDVLHEMAYMAALVASHCRCRIRAYSDYDSQRSTWLSKVYGYESDLRYFEIMYTTLRLHMVGALIPSWDDSQTVGENVYRFHNAGFNWVDIARMHGWRKQPQWKYPDVKTPFKHKVTGEVIPNNDFGKLFKAPYLRECKARGTKLVKITPSGAKTWRRCAADGYTNRISQRLAEVAGTRDESSVGALVLRRDDLDAYFRDQNPDLFPDPVPESERPKRRRAAAFRERPFNADAYSSGSRHADSADLGGPKFSKRRTEIGA